MVNNKEREGGADFLLEIGTEELPARSLQDLVANLAFNIEKGLQVADLNYKAAFAYAGARRLAVLVHGLSFKQKDQLIERRGPALAASFDEDGNPTQACLGFANSCGVSVLELSKYKTSAGAWVLYRKNEPGKNVFELMPALIEDALKALVISKAMRWGNQDITFVRPVRWLVTMYGDKLVKTNLFGVESAAVTYGHRFHHPQPINIPNASEYVSILFKIGFVIVDIDERKEAIRRQIAELTKQRGTVIIDEDLLDEVSGLTEWPKSLLCTFNKRFLDMPGEVLKAVMKNYQRCFCMIDDQGQLLPYFVAVSNIDSKSPEKVIAGNERVMHARLNDIEFFYQSDLKLPLSDYVNKLKDVVYQEALGSVFDKVIRIENLAVAIAGKIGANVESVRKGAFLAKADLMTSVVKELPELQGVIGYYYAKKIGESNEVALAIREHYLPRYSGDVLPSSDIAVAIALADRIDSLIGIFGIGEIPSGDKDPFALRRAALAVIRIIIEKRLSLDLLELLELAKQNYSNKFKKTLVPQILDFIFDRLRGWYLDQGIAANVFHAVLARSPTSLVDFQRRIRAVENFQMLKEATALIAAHKRVNNILKKSGFVGQVEFNSDLLVEDAERQLASEITEATKIIAPFYAEGFYAEALKILAELKTSIDNFFDTVMVMAEDETLRNNRLALLVKLRDLFCFVADISLL